MACTVHTRNDLRGNKASIVHRLLNDDHCIYILAFLEQDIYKQIVSKGDTKT